MGAPDGPSIIRPTSRPRRWRICTRPRVRLAGVRAGVQRRRRPVCTAGPACALRPQVEWQPTSPFPCRFSDVAPGVRLTSTTSRQPKPDTTGRYFPSCRVISASLRVTLVFYDRRLRAAIRWPGPTLGRRTGTTEMVVSIVLTGQTGQPAFHRQLLGVGRRPGRSYRRRCARITAQVSPQLNEPCAMNPNILGGTGAN